jgi:hypothetical protein
VQVRGVAGFQPGYDVRIVLVPAVRMNGSFVQGSTASGLANGMLLGSARPGKDYAFDATVRIPSLREIDSREAPHYKIVAIGRNDQLDGQYFAVAADFTFTGTAAPTAESVDTGNAPRLPVWTLWASLGLAGLAIAGWRIRHYGQEEDHGNDTQRGPEGP